MNAHTRDVARTVIERCGEPYADELGIRLAGNGPAALFQLLVFALLASARISHRTALDAARALADAGWTTPRKLADSTWRQRTDTLNHAGYARYDERTARMLGDTARRLLDEYGGDLRRLRAAADRDPGEERRRLRAFSGIGDTGVDIFFREAQAVWPELQPFVDDRARRAARRLGLPSDGEALAEAVSRKQFPRLVAGLVRCDLEDGYDEVESALADGSARRKSSRSSA